MRVSVLIPAFNCANVIDRAVASAVTQAFDGELEVIIRDDGSSDDTLTRAEALAHGDPRILVHANGRNEGVSATRNKLIEESTGEWVAFLDADDIFLPDKITRCLAFAARAHADAVLHGLTYLTNQAELAARSDELIFFRPVCCGDRPSARRGSTSGSKSVRMAIFSLACGKQPPCIFFPTS